MATSTMAPCEVNDTTSPSTVVPTAKLATKLMNASGSLTAGGGVMRFLSTRPAALAADVVVAATAFLALARFGGAAFLVDPFDLEGLAGWSASSTASSMAFERTGSTLTRPGGGTVGVMGHIASTAETACLVAFFAFGPRLAAFFAA